MKTSSALKQSRRSLLCSKTHVCSFQVYPPSFLMGCNTGMTDFVFKKNQVTTVYQ